MSNHGVFAARLHDHGDGYIPVYVYAYPAAKFLDLAIGSSGTGRFCIQIVNPEDARALAQALTDAANYAEGGKDDL